MPVPTKVEKDVKIQKFIDDVMLYAKSQVQWDLYNNPFEANAGKVTWSSNIPQRQPMMNEGIVPKGYNTVGSKEEPLPSVDAANPAFRHIDSAGGAITASALAQIFQSFAYNITRYRRVRMRILGTGGMPNIPSGTANNTKATALNSDHRMPQTTFKNLVNASPNIGNLTPGNPLAQDALDNLILTLRDIVISNMSSGTYATISACHNSCHGSCHGSRNRR